MTKTRALNINFFGGPCVGKSATSAGVFNELKIRGHNVDITLEYAKDLVYGEEWVKLSDQLAVAGEQHHRMFRLQDKVEYAVHDSPFIMGLNYSCNSKLPKLEFATFLVGQFNRYQNYNILLVRNPNLEFKEDGRLQDLAGSIKLDNEIRHMLDRHGIKYIEVLVDENVVNTICDNIEGK